ncbi:MULTISPECIES: TRAP transporter small permease [Halomonadaceae]|uniref:TRAP transporter small permease protein n=1 Tax=Modicisalibacter zincidurans TaxID=1178777 RepID=A0ABP9RLN1_9GAMM|nr:MULTISPECIES: TRAP transporter small permease [Halomonas]MCD6009469.1 TRAP transporter small permease [Halomonas sp. IOP_31]
MWRWFDKLEDILAIVLLGCTSLTILASATMRAIGHPFAGGAELAQFFFIWTAVLGADIMLRRGGQVRIDALVVLMPPRVLRAITAVILAMMLAFLALLAWYGMPLALSNWQRPMGFAGLSYGYVTLALPVGAALMFVSLLRRVLDKGITRSLEPDDDVVEETL